MRLRFPPTTPTVSVGGDLGRHAECDHSGGPQCATTGQRGFAQDRSKVYLHWRRSGGAGADPGADGWVDVTANTTRSATRRLNFAVSVHHSATPLAYLSYHVFQGVYADGKTATRITAGLVASVHSCLLGVFPVDDSDLEGGKAFVDAALDRGFNAIQIKRAARFELPRDQRGKAYAASRGYGMIVWNQYSDGTPCSRSSKTRWTGGEQHLREFLLGYRYKIPCGSSPMGILGMRGKSPRGDLRAKYPNTPPPSTSPPPSSRRILLAGSGGGCLQSIRITRSASRIPIGSIPSGLRSTRRPTPTSMPSPKGHPGADPTPIT